MTCIDVQEAPTESDETTKLIDGFLATTSGRSLISSDEVADFLLDLRLSLNRQN